MATATIKMVVSALDNTVEVLTGCLQHLNKVLDKAEYMAPEEQLLLGQLRVAARTARSSLLRELRKASR